jgi:hypothetical protein
MWARPNKHAYGMGIHTDKAHSSQTYDHEKIARNILIDLHIHLQFGTSALLQVQH